MALKPIVSGSIQRSAEFATETTANRIAYETLQTKALSSDRVKNKLVDPEGIIPNGIYKVFRLERNVKLASIIISSIVAFFSLLFCILFAAAPKIFSNDGKVKWGHYIIPVILLGLSIYMFIIELIELIGISRSVVFYRESIQRGAISTPPFITLLYRKLIMKQVRRTWFVVAIIFYVGLFTLIFYGLKDVDWKGLHFKKWIDNTFKNPMAVVYVLCAIMLVSLILHIALTIFRKKRLVDIQSFFGNEVMDYNDLQEKKSKAHRFYAKIFFISILVLLIIPFIIYIVLRKTVWKGK